jgi:uncharacterized protein YndB with AHSA1/START domain
MNTSTEQTAAVTKPTDRTIHVERIFNAPRERVWNAYTQPDLVAQWWGRGNKLVIEKLELKPGGKWRFVEHGPEGPFGFEGEFREIIPQERLVWTFGWDGMPGKSVLETSNFVDMGDGRTKVVSDSLFESAEERDAMLGYGMEKGMNESYAALDRLLARAD